MSTFCSDSRALLIEKNGLIVLFARCLQRLLIKAAEILLCERLGNKLSCTVVNGVIADAERLLPLCLDLLQLGRDFY